MALRKFLERRRLRGQQRPSQYRYTGLPTACICYECGYTLENPSTHCRGLTCPQCGSPLWRKK